MTDSGRGPKDSRRRSSKQSSKSSSTTQQPPTERSRPKSDTQGAKTKAPKQAVAGRRPQLDDRTYSSPGDINRGAGPTSRLPSLSIPSAQHETFLLRPSIDQSAAPPPSPADPPAITDNDDGDDDDDASVQEENDRLQETGERKSQENSTKRNRKAVVPVVGAPGSGKSTFVKHYFHAQGKHDSRNASPSSTKDAPDVVLEELDFDDIDILEDGQIEWPDSLQDKRESSIEGVVVLYDVMNRASFLGVKRILGALMGTSTPTALVASKCDLPSDKRAVDPDVVEEKVKSAFEDVRLFQISLTKANSNAPNACVSSLLGDKYSNTVHRSMKSDNATNVPGSNSSQTLIDSESEPLPPQSSTDSFKASSTPPVASQTPNRQASQSKGKLHIQTALAVPDRAGDRSPRSFLDLEESPRLNFTRTPAAEEEPEPVSLDNSNVLQAFSPPADSTLTFDELTEKFLHSSPAKLDPQFVGTFLTFYRFFAPPLRLLEAVIKHFDYHDGNIITPWVHDAILERDLSIIDRWITLYPGDFAKTSMKQQLRRFLARLIKEHGLGGDDDPTGFTGGGTLVETYGEAATIAASASDINLALEAVAEDDDTDWACSDSGPPPRNRNNTFLSMSSLDSQTTVSPSDLDERHAKNTMSNPAYDAKLIFGGQTTLTLTAMGRSRPHDSGKSTQTPVNVAESAQRQAQLLSPKPTQSFGKVHWRSFMNFPDEQIARELTRIDWIMFSSIRPRDLIRHVTIPVSERARFRGLENVSRMIDHFNHLAYWVTNVVLFRDKPKHRALALEKFMRVARKLRELNNYNALGAIIAGIQGTSVHRLKSTKDLVNQNVQKDYMKLEILMAATKGHWAYRLAWENTRTARVPFLPLHRRDLVVADAGGKTFVAPEQNAGSHTDQPDADGDQIKPVQDGVDAPKRPKAIPSPRSLPNTHTLSTQPHALEESSEPVGSSTARINWGKFSIMGNILNNITQAQSVPYIGFAANEDIRALILSHSIVKDDDELYERSTALEPPASGGLAGGGPSGGSMALTHPASGAVDQTLLRKKVIYGMSRLVG